MSIVKLLLIILLVTGMAMCSRGIGKIAANNDWLHPAALAGYVMGLSLLVLFYFGIAGKKFFFLADEKQILIAILGIIALKFLVGSAYAAFGR